MAKKKFPKLRESSVIFHPKILTNFFIFKIGGLIAKKNMLKGAREKKNRPKKREKRKK